MGTKVDKAILKKRILIFLAICFGMTWIYDLAVVRNISVVKTGFLKQVLSACGMYFPLIAHLCTRAVTKEGFNSAGDGSLMIKLNHKKLLWLFVAMLLPFIYCEIGNAILVLIYPNLLLSKSMCKAFGITAGVLTRKIGIQFMMSLLFTFVAIGEESGFRGYMMPKLIKLFGTGKAVYIGGIVWGLWHLPLICMGLNFGTEYPGFPFLGIILMTVDCICAGSILTFLTIKTKSIWPAAVMHAVNNSRPGVLSLLLNSYELGKMNTIVAATITQIPLFILGVICIWIMVNQDVFHDRDTHLNRSLFIVVKR